MLNTDYSQEPNLSVRENRSISKTQRTLLKIEEIYNNLLEETEKLSKEVQRLKKAHVEIEGIWFEVIYKPSLLSLIYFNPMLETDPFFTPQNTELGEEILLNFSERSVWEKRYRKAFYTLKTLLARYIEKTYGEASIHNVLNKYLFEINDSKYLMYRDLQDSTGENMCWKMLRLNEFIYTTETVKEVF